MNNEKIYGGGFLLARQIFNSEVWCKKPSSWGKIWIYILGKVHHEQTNDFGRGEGFFNFSQEKKLIGIDITDDIIKKFMCFARTSLMISTRRSTRGVVIKILQYNKFQDFNNYKSTSSGTREAREKHERSTTINNNVKKVKKEKNIYMVISDFNSFWGLYPNKVGKTPTQKKFLKLKKELLPELLEALKIQIETDQWKKGFIPNPLTWINQERWQDEVKEKTREEEARELVKSLRPEYGSEAEDVAMFRFSKKYGDEEILKFKKIFKL